MAPGIYFFLEKSYIYNHKELKQGLSPKGLKKMKHYYVVTHYHGKARKNSCPFKTRKAAERWAKICQAGAPMSVTYEIVSEEA